MNDDVTVTNFTLHSSPAWSTIGTGGSVRQQSFQERAHSSSVGEYFAVRRAPSTEPLESRDQLQEQEQAEQLPAEQPAQPSIPT